MAGKFAYYQGMASAPKVQPADLVTPFANMFERMRQDNINKVKEFQAQQKEQERINRSRLENFQNVVLDSGFKGFGLEQFDMVMNTAADNMIKLARGNNQLVNEGRITNEEADARMIRAISEHKKLQNAGNQISSLVQGDLKLGDKGSLYNDLMLSFIDDANSQVALDIKDNGSGAIMTRSKDDDSLRRMPFSKFAEFFQLRQATDLTGVLEDIVDASEPRQVAGKKTISSYYLDYSKTPDGDLTTSQYNVLTKRLQNFSEAEVYDAAARAGIVGDNEGQIPVRTDLSDESLIANIDEMRERLAVHSAGLLRDMYKNQESRKPKSPKGGTGTNAVYSVYDNDTGIYSYRRNSQTSFTLKNGFEGFDMINGKPSEKAKDIPPSSWVTDVRLTPAGVEVWGVQIKDQETGEVKWSNTAPTSMSDEEVSQMGGNRVNFHKVIPVNEGNQQAIGELQRVFGFKPEDLQAQLSLGVGVNNEASGETIPEVDLNDPSRYE